MGALMSPPIGKGIKMVLTEVHRDLNSDRLTPEALKWIILHMACDTPDRYADALKDLNAHMVKYPESRTVLGTIPPVVNVTRCCGGLITCQCNIRTCTCTCDGCFCG